MLKSILPDVDWLLAHFSSKGEWVRFPPEFTDALKRLKIERYAELYLDERRIPNLLAQVMFDGEARASLETLGADATEAEVTAFMDEKIHELVSSAECWHIPKTPKEKATATQYWNSLSDEERREASRVAQIVWTGFLASFYNYLSAMVHRFTLTVLVRKAVDGDDDALAMAVQIDRSILVDLPYAVDRFRRAARECDASFFEKIGYRLANPVIRGRIRFRQLWLALAILDSMNLLDGSISHLEILDILSEAGMDRYENRIEAVEYLSKRIGEFRAFQRRVGGDLP